MAFPSVFGAPSLHDRWVDAENGLQSIMHSVICSGPWLVGMFCNHKCTKFGQLILGKIIKIVANRCQILRLKCTKFDFGWGYAPDPAGG